ncbi:type II toxin-antitoxin system YafQ family toxin [Thermodesulfobium sp. 4217-1]|uniref:type II toxin-antitoxin system YafQ family toxin n=1 Tax=Thermodesulfobium sp. 4217-1 TaxID=3120013 RepID=UPI0032216495
MLEVSDIKLSKTRNFKKHYLQRVNLDCDKIFVYVVDKLLKNQPLEKKFKDHALVGNFSNLKECHLKPDLLLIYQLLDDELRLIDIGSHS